MAVVDARTGQSGSRTRYRPIIELSVITAVAVAGSVAAVFAVLSSRLQNVMADLPLLVAIPVGLSTVFTLLLAGGAMFGWGVARHANAPRTQPAKVGAGAFYLTIVTVEVPIHFSQVFIDSARSISSWGPHVLFAVVFCAEAALVATVTTRRVLGVLGFSEAQLWGRCVGRSAAVGFAVGAAIAAIVGFQVGRSGPMAMVWALHLANVVAGLAAGATLGRRIDRT